MPHNLTSNEEEKGAHSDAAVQFALSTRQHLNRGSENLYPGWNFVKAPLSVTLNAVCVWTKGQNAKKRVCFPEYQCTCGQGETYHNWPNIRGVSLWV